VLRRRHLVLALQVVVSVALFALLTRNLPAGSLIGALGRVRPGTVAAAVALVLVGYVGRARRWSVLLARSGVTISGLHSYALTLVGTFYGVLTPGRVGEFARVMHLGLPRSRTLPSVVWDRVTDVLLLEALCLPGFALVPEWRGPLLGAFVAMVLFTALGVAVLASAEVARSAARLMPFLARPVASWLQTSEGLLSSRPFFSSLGWGVFFYVFMYGAAWLLLRDLAPHASGTLLLGLPVIPLLGNLPIAFGGLGLREHVSAVVFGNVGAGSATGAAFSLLLFTVATLLPGLLGLLVSAFPAARARVVEPPA
jgi:uncharacterized membrane protein YbhN (UPF0104 family)